MKKFFFLWIAVAVLTAACSNNAPADSDTAADTAATTTETAANTDASTAEDGVAIALVSPEDGSVPMGDAEFVVEAIDPATNEPVPVEDLQVEFWMEMEGTEPMTAMSKVEPGDRPGQYKVRTNLGMVGAWVMEVESADPALSGEKAFDITVVESGN
ncbi:FixH family protein [Baaleninema simplex]|uniref:FixH family protein n=1 Tax=Baaleninema simplex TaxID=2862350 RepID=UPI0003451C9E|nr:FixH family protein [Baaleninema simplex]